MSKWPTVAAKNGDFLAGGGRPEGRVVVCRNIIDPDAPRLGPRPLAISERTAERIGALIDMVPARVVDELRAELSDARAEVERLRAVVAACTELRDAAAVIATMDLEV